MYGLIFENFSGYIKVSTICQSQSARNIFLEYSTWSSSWPAQTRWSMARRRGTTCGRWPTLTHPPSPSTRCPGSNLNDDPKKVNNKQCSYKAGHDIYLYDRQHTYFFTSFISMSWMNIRGLSFSFLFWAVWNIRGLSRATSGKDCKESLPNPGMQCRWVLWGILVIINCISPPTS